MSRFRPYRSKNMRSRAIGNRRAADQQRDITQVTLRTQITRGGGQTLTYLGLDENLSAEENQTNIKNWFDTGVIVINMYDALLRCEYYKNYANMYDQVRIDYLKVDIKPVVWTTSREEATLPGYVIPQSLKVVTAWDRSGISDNEFIFDEGDDESDREELEEGEGGRNRTKYCIIGSNIDTYGSAITKTLGSGGSFKITRYLYPQNEQEKNQFVSTDCLVPQFTQYIEEPYEFELKKGYKENKHFPNHPVESSEVPFKPTLLIAVLSPYKPYIGPNYDWYNGPTDHYIGWNKLRPTIFTIDIEFTVTFRGLRYNKMVN